MQHRENGWRMNHGGPDCLPADIANDMGDAAARSPGRMSLSNARRPRLPLAADSASSIAIKAGPASDEDDQPFSQLGDKD